MVRRCDWLIPFSAAALAVAGCAPQNVYQAPPPPEVTVAAPQAKRVAEVVEFTGSVAASERVEIRARVKGFLERQAFEEGQEVSEGDLLFVIDQRPFVAAADQAEAALSLAEAQVLTAESAVVQAQARAANADSQLRRSERAAEGGAVTEAELDDLRTERDVAIADYRAAESGVVSAKAQVDVAKAEVAQTMLDLGYTEVKAPMNGRVGRRAVDLGNLVGAGDPTLLTEIVRYDPVHVYFTVTEREFLEHVRNRPDPAGDSGLTLREREKVVRLQLEGEEGFPHSGVLDFADLEIEAATGTYLLRARFDNSDRLIPPGAFARVQVPGDEVDVLLVDEAAISRSPAGEFVTVVNAENKCERRAVKLGHQEGTQRVVLEGLQPSDRVVVNGLIQARPGIEVRAVEASPSPESGSPNDA